MMVLRTMNIKSLAMKNINGLKNVWYKSTKDHSKWVVTGNSSVHWTCIGDINRAVCLCSKYYNIKIKYMDVINNINIKIFMFF